MPLRLFRFLSSLLIPATRGTVAIYVGLTLVMTIGLIALGTDVVFLLMKHRQMQSAADSAAISGARALAVGVPADYAMQARSVASASGFVNGVDGVTVTVNSPPVVSTGNAGLEGAVEVIVSQPQNQLLLGLFRSGIFPVGAMAVAANSGSYEYCFLALGSGGSPAAFVANNAVVANPDCGVAVNSSSSPALTLGENAVIRGPVNVVGEWLLNNNSDLQGSPNFQHATAVENPYESLTAGTPPGCTSTSGIVNGTKTLSAGHYCSGFDFKNSSTVTLSQGTYYVDSKFVTGNGVTIKATSGVTIIINGNYTINLGNSNIINVVAPTSGTFAGIAFYGPTAIGTQVFSNNVNLNVQGVLYFPEGTVNFNNNGITTTSKCTQIVAKYINISNNAALNNDCVGTGVSTIGGGATKLVE